MDVPPFKNMGGMVDEIIANNVVVGYCAPRNMPSSSFSRSGLAVVDGEPEYLPSNMTLSAYAAGVQRLRYTRMCWEKSLYDELFMLLDDYFGKHFVGCEVFTYEEALEKVDFETSPGWWYYYYCNTKGQVYEKFWDQMLVEMDSFDTPEPFTPPITPTLKDELLHKSKVKANVCKVCYADMPLDVEECPDCGGGRTAIKSRLFYNLGFSHNLKAKTLFYNQNQALNRTVLRHPCTIGVDLPGPGFIQLYSQLNNFAESKPRCGDDDISGCDMLFQHLVASVIKNLRKEYLPKRCHQAVDNTYSLAFLGYLVLLGVIVESPSICPSGWENTGHDTSMMKCCYYFVIFRDLNPQFAASYVFYFKKYFLPYCGGDDGIYAVHTEFVFWDPVVVVQSAAKRGIFMEMTSRTLKMASECVFLSHHIERIDVNGIRYAVAAGRLPKLISAIAWKHRKDAAFTVARFYGICNALFPWPACRRQVLEMVDAWVGAHSRNKIPDEAWLQAKSQRLTDSQLLTIHTGW